MQERQLTLSGEGFEEKRLSLAEWDVILVNSSGGKDSQTTLRQVVLAADAGNVPRHRIVVAHADLGRVEWPGTKALAKEQAEAYGVELRTMKRPQGDLLTHIERRGMFPGPGTRYCTSDHKRGQIAKIITALDRERRDGDTFRVLNCMGLRAEESPARRKKTAFSRNGYFSTQSRTVWDWLPIHGWTEQMVWKDIRESGVRYHEAYDIGMPRLSCVFCIYAPKPALVLAARHNPALLDEYVAVEGRIGHTFRVDVSMTEIKRAAECDREIEAVGGQWNM